MALITVDEALIRLLSKTPELQSEVVSLDCAGHRTIAKPIVAKLTQPPFAPSAMDGYALKVSDVAAVPTILTVIGEAAAGHSFDGPIGERETVRIFTGAPLPQDADTVIMQENIRKLDDNRIEILSPVKQGANIRPVGGDFHAGKTILEKGHILTPAALALCASAGYGEVDVIRKPRVGILSTGDELVAAGTLPGPNQIVSSNAHALAEIIRNRGGEVIDFGIVADNREALSHAIAQAKASGIDVLVTSGGVSVGDYDLVQEMMVAAGMELDFWQIAMRPGKPLMFGTMAQSDTSPAGMLILGLPGNPVSSIVSANLFLVPILDKMSGRKTDNQLREVHLGSPLPANGMRRHYLRARLERDDQGGLWAFPATSADSSLLSILTHSDCLIVQEIDSPALAQGSPCNIFIPKGGL